MELIEVSGYVAEEKVNIAQVKRENLFVNFLTEADAPLNKNPGIYMPQHFNMFNILCDFKLTSNINTHSTGGFVKT